MNTSFKLFLRKTERSFYQLFAVMQSNLGLKPTLVKTDISALLYWQYEFKKFAKSENKAKIGLVAIRNNTWVEWAVYAAHIIYKMGYEPVLIYSLSELEDIYRRPHLNDFSGLHFPEYFKKLPFQKIDIDASLPVTDSEKQMFKAEGIAAGDMIAAYNLKVEEFETDFKPEEYKREVIDMQNMVSHYCFAAQKALADGGIDRFVAPSGLIEKSVAFEKVAKKNGLTGIYLEGWAMRPGHMIWNFNKPALEYDIEGWMNVLGPWDQKKEAEYSQFKKFQEREVVEHDDEWLAGFHSVQRAKINDIQDERLKKFLEGNEPVFLAATNVVGDSSTLNRHLFFKNQKEWLAKLCDFFAKHPELKLIIRTHPDELWQKSKIRLGEFAQNKAKGIPNIYIIGSDDSTNTYSLIPFIKCGLPWMSTVGLDLIIRGIPVVMAANPKYSGIGVVDLLNSETDYFNTILLAAKGAYTVSENQKTMAKYYQLIVFKYMSLEASGKHYMSYEYKLEKGWMHKEQETFYKILVGELDEKGKNF